MRRLTAALMVAVGVVSLALGLLFLVASQGHSRRFIVALVGMGLGAVLTGLGARLFKRLDRALPERVRAEVLALAQREGGEVSLATLEAALSRGGPPRWEVGRRVLEDLVRQGQAARRVDQDGTARFVFPGLQARMVVRRCRFCGAVLPLDEVVTTCPQCGGQVDTALERVGSAESAQLGADELFSMDEESDRGGPS